MSDAPLDPRDRAGYRDDLRTNRADDAVYDRGAYGAEPIVERDVPVVGLARNGAGTAALVLGILGLLTSWLLVGGVLGLIAVVCGVVGLGRVNRREATNRGSAMAGVVLGLLAVAASIAVGVAGKSFYDRNKSDFKNLNDCLKSATTSAQQTSCQNQFKDAVTK
jgi:hypothetical protein